MNFLFLEWLQYIIDSIILDRLKRIFIKSRTEYDGNRDINVFEDFKNEFGAESQHMVTQILLDQGLKFKNAGQAAEANAKFEETKTAGIYLKNAYPTFNYWKAKSFLNVAEANYELGEVFQAKGVLESLVSEDRFPEIQKAAQDRLAEIQAEEDAQNALPPSDGNN